MIKGKAFNFTKKAIEALKIPASSRDYYKDSTEKGLQLSITANGTITFFLRRKINGKSERIIIGHFPDLSVENARNFCSKLKNEIAHGKNPNTEKKKITTSITFQEFTDKYIDEYAKKHKKSYKEDLRIINSYASLLLKIKIGTITQNDIEKLHHKVGEENGKVQANRLISLLKGIYNRNIKAGYEGINVCLNITMFKEKSRDRFLQGDELPRFFMALKDEQNTTIRDYVLISLLTGARRSNVLSMEWKQINFEVKTWRIPETKNGESQTVPLSEIAINILLKRKKDNRENSTWVFQSDSKSGHLTDPKRAWKRILTRANIENLRIHDLRRTLGSWQAATGANSYIIGKSLGHKSQEATAIYARLNLDPVRESVNRATNAMFDVINRGEDSLIEIKKGD